MDEPAAWIYQASADREAAEQLIAEDKKTGRCHAIAKWQQTVEKSIKAIVCALHEAGILGAGPKPRHSVERYVDMLVRLPRTPGNKTIQNLLKGLLDQKTRSSIRTLDTLAPQLPTRRNTEYPFEIEIDSGKWTYPAAEGIFLAEEVDNFRSLSLRILESGFRILSAIRRRPS
jgi:hypothetical protein